MTIKIHYGEEDDVFTIYDDEHEPYETIEFSEFLNIDIDKDRNVVGIEVFYANEFFSAINDIINKEILSSITEIEIECKNYRNNWFMVLIFNYEGKKIRVQMPPLRKSEFTSPLIASVQ